MHLPRGLHSCITYRLIPCMCASAAHMSEPLLIRVEGGEELKYQSCPAAALLEMLEKDPRAGRGVLLNKDGLTFVKSGNVLQANQGPFKFLRLISEEGALGQGRGDAVAALAQRGCRCTGCHLCQKKVARLMGLGMGIVRVRAGQSSADPEVQAAAAITWPAHMLRWLSLPRPRGLTQYLPLALPPHHVIQQSPLPPDHLMQHCAFCTLRPSGYLHPCLSQVQPQQQQASAALVLSKVSCT